MSRILVVGHGAAATGFSRVIHALIQHLSHDYEFHHFAVNHRSQQLDREWPIYGNPDPLDGLGLERLGTLIEQLRPAVLLMVNDLWFCSVHGQRLAQMRERPVTIAYCPVDGILTRRNLYSPMGRFDQVVAYNQFGRDQLESITCAGLPVSSRCLTGRIEIIPHGVDRDAFFPLAPDDLLDRSQAKRQLLGAGTEGDFVVLNAAKHDARKRLDLTIAGFARFARSKPAEVKLYLHTAALFEGNDLRVLARQAGIAERLVTTPGWMDGHPSVDDGELNAIYNAADVGINTSGGEGWGLVSVEHAATGAPQVVPLHTGCQDIWRGVETTLPTRRVAEHVGLGMRREFVSEEDVAANLERLYTDREFRRTQAQVATHIAQRPEYAWPRIAEQWDRIFRVAIEQQNARTFIRHRALSYAQ